jgi:hypothetical protein
MGTNVELCETPFCSHTRRLSAVHFSVNVKIIIHFFVITNGYENKCKSFGRRDKIHLMISNLVAD